MHRTIEALYKNGKIIPLEDIIPIREGRVLITFMDEEEKATTRKKRLKLKTYRCGGKLRDFTRDDAYVARIWKGFYWYEYSNLRNLWRLRTWKACSMYRNSKWIKSFKCISLSIFANIERILCHFHKSNDLQKAAHLQAGYSENQRIPCTIFHYLWKRIDHQCSYYLDC